MTRSLKICRSCDQIFTRNAFRGTTYSTPEVHFCQAAACISLPNGDVSKEFEAGFGIGRLFEEREVPLKCPRFLEHTVLTQEPIGT